MTVMIICAQIAFGGAGRVAVMIANGLLERGHHVVFLTNLHYKDNYGLNKGVELHNYSANLKVGFFKHIMSILKIRKIIKYTRPDIIIGIMWLCSLLGWLASRGMKIPVVSSEHNAFERPQSDPMSKFEWFTKSYFNKLYDCVTVLTNADKEIANNYLQNVVVMPNPVFLTTCDEGVVKEKVIMACGRVYDWYVKGFDILIEAWSKISEQYPEWKVVIVGGGDQDSISYLDSLCESNSVGTSVEFTGFSKDVKSFYEKAEIFVLSSRHEGFGLVLVEAMSQGCACVAFDFKGRISEIVSDGVDGVICHTNDAESLSLAIKNVIDNESLRRQLQQAAGKKCIKFSIENIVLKWESLLNSLVSNN